MKIQEKKELLQLIETVRNLQEKIKNNISDLSNQMIDSNIEIMDIYKDNSTLLNNNISNTQAAVIESIVNSSKEIDNILFNYKNETIELVEVLKKAVNDNNEIIKNNFDEYSTKEVTKSSFLILLRFFTAIIQFCNIIR